MEANGVVQVDMEAENPAQHRKRPSGSVGCWWAERHVIFLAGTRRLRKVAKQRIRVTP
jgi:hypothetical protein